MHWTNRVKFKLLIAAIKLGIYNRTYISLVDFGLTDDDLGELLAALDASPQVKAAIELIDLSNTKVEGPSVNTLSWVFLKDFPRLKTLILSKNKIQVLRLEGTGALEILRVNINRLRNIYGLENLSKLTELDVGYNKLKAIDLRALKVLKKFIGCFNLFTSLNLALKPNLQIAEIDNNPLETVFIKGAPLNTRFTISARKLDVASRLEIARFDQGLAIQNQVENFDYYLSAPLGLLRVLLFGKQ